jgi:hypothetical protein
MKKVLLVIMCLLLFGCGKKQMPEVKKEIEMTDSAKELANDFQIDFNLLDLDIDIIDSNKTSFTLYLSRDVTDEEAISDFKTICDFIKTFVKKGKLYDYYNFNKEFDYSTIDENTRSVLLKASIKSKDYKITINRMNGLSYKGSENTYSIYKINILEKDFD